MAVSFLVALALPVNVTNSFSEYRGSIRGVPGPGPRFRTEEAAENSTAGLLPFGSSLRRGREHSVQMHDHDGTGTRVWTGRQGGGLVSGYACDHQHGDFEGRSH